VIVLFRGPALNHGIDLNPICIDSLTFDNQVTVTVTVTVKVKEKALVQLKH